ncbi:hypothetical protein R3P38DRAFT_2788123 [Favolaschia claudopus]|uniref:Uncharacterized protein n=1 Tax=Favolaschia claudopus TaxID=2862362 RepID=A0AAW0AL10_9AGAR
MSGLTATLETPSGTNEHDDAPNASISTSPSSADGVDVNERFDRRIARLVNGTLSSMSVRRPAPREKILVSALSRPDLCATAAFATRQGSQLNRPTLLGWLPAREVNRFTIIILFPPNLPLPTQLVATYLNLHLSALCHGFSVNDVSTRGSLSQDWALDKFVSLHATTISPVRASIVRIIQTTEFSNLSARLAASVPIALSTGAPTIFFAILSTFEELLSVEGRISRTSPVFHRFSVTAHNTRTWARASLINAASVLEAELAVDEFVKDKVETADTAF